MDKDESILKYYVMPLFGIPFQLLKEEYVNAYLHKDGYYLFIQVSPDCKISFNMSTYEGTIDIGDITFHMFSIPDKFMEDIKLLMKGNYSEMSDTAKNTIIELSGLVYNQRNVKDKTITTSAQLLALYKHPQLRKSIESKLGMQLPEELELWEKLSKKAFIEYIVEPEEE